MTRRHTPRRVAFVNQKPTKVSLANAPRSAVKTEFGRRLQAAMVEKGWRQSDLARHASMHTPKGRPIGRDAVSLYIRGITLPGSLFLEALAKALGKSPQELLPARGVPTAGENHPHMDLRDLGDGNAWLRVNQAVAWPVALQVMKILQEMQ